MGKKILAITFVLAVALVVTGCAQKPTPTPTTTPKQAPWPTPTPTLTISDYPTTPHFSTRPPDSRSACEQAREVVANVGDGYTLNQIRAPLTHLRRRAVTATDVVQLAIENMLTAVKALDMDAFKIAASQMNDACIDEGYLQPYRNSGSACTHARIAAGFMEDGLTLEESRGLLLHACREASTATDVVQLAVCNMLRAAEVLDEEAYKVAAVQLWGACNAEGYGQPW